MRRRYLILWGEIQMKLIRKSEQEIRKCIKAQEKHIADLKAPHFAPENGICDYCGRNIYQNYGWMRNEYLDIGRAKAVVDDGAEVDFVTGHNIERAKNELITGCPHCNRSFCD